MSPLWFFNSCLLFAGNTSHSPEMPQVTQEIVHGSHNISTYGRVGGTHQPSSPQYYQQHVPAYHPSLYAGYITNKINVMTYPRIAIESWSPCITTVSPYVYKV